MDFCCKFIFFFSKRYNNKETDEQIFAVINQIASALLKTLLSRAKGQEGLKFNTRKGRMIQLP